MNFNDDIERLFADEQARNERSAFHEADAEQYSTELLNELALVFSENGVIVEIIDPNLEEGSVQRIKVLSTPNYLGTPPDDVQKAYSSFSDWITMAKSNSAEASWAEDAIVVALTELPHLEAPILIKVAEDYMGPLVVATILTNMGFDLTQDITTDFGFETKVSFVRITEDLEADQYRKNLEVKKAMRPELTKKLDVILPSVHDDFEKLLTGFEIAVCVALSDITEDEFDSRIERTLRDHQSLINPSQLHSFDEVALVGIARETAAEYIVRGYIHTD